MTTYFSVPHVDLGSTREDRARDLVAALGRFITETAENTYSVPSRDGRRTYTVRYGPDVDVDEERCS